MGNERGETRVVIGVEMGEMAPDLFFHPFGSSESYLSASETLDFLYLVVKGVSINIARLRPVRARFRRFSRFKTFHALIQSVVSNTVVYG